MESFFTSIFAAILIGGIITTLQIIFNRKNPGITKKKKIAIAAVWTIVLFSYIGIKYAEHKTINAMEELIKPQAYPKTK